jgi:hypothetical protein
MDTRVKPVYDDLNVRRLPGMTVHGMPCAQFGALQVKPLK